MSARLLLVALDDQQVVPPTAMMLFAVSRWTCIVSAMTTAPRRSKRVDGWVNAGISLLLAATWRWAMTVWLPCRATASRWTAVLLPVREPRTASPTTAGPTRTSSFSTGAAAWQARQVPTASPSTAPSMRAGRCPSVEALGMSRARSSQSGADLRIGVRRVPGDLREGAGSAEHRRQGTGPADGVSST
ncbi:hypothetical protein AQJ27_50185 [Streptomyces olivochromogenes]|uniref:hypothetical protein n=1 Tax=Streptomyces olivochromogenes TaxID=1963 RepID=UPI00074A9095|nr:hypothetical protein [Streptomyces olivochromogenes]KUN33588.1 hypothetical protein AQJ27_50185 [Streptomyces olivochromogenes]